MQQIRCPHCNEVFTIDESNYNSIVKQIRDHVFADEIASRTKEIEERMIAQLNVQVQKEKSAGKDAVARKEKELEELKSANQLLESQYEARMAQAMSDMTAKMNASANEAAELLRQKASVIDALQSQIAAAKQEKDSAVRETKALSSTELAEKLAAKDAELAKLKSEHELTAAKLQAQIASLMQRLDAADREKNSAVKEATAVKEKEAEAKLAESVRKVDTLEAQMKMASLKAESDLKDAVAKKENELSQMRVQLHAKETEKQLAVQQAVAQVRTEAEAKLVETRSDFEAKLSRANTDLELAQQEVQQLKDFKARQSTKMIGESLEQHCATVFNRNRMGMFPKAYFEKDNDARTGSKGDFIYRDYDEEGTEFISIMFEMKNEADTTATKHKNEDFFKELDKDRREKKCEYAILVSMLEADSELYNEGIVDVSYRYPKMYVIRPQFFISIITLLRNAAMNSAQYRRQLEIEKRNNVDVTNFEANMEAFKSAFGNNFRLAQERFEKAIEEIDKSIDHLQKIKANLTSSERQLRLANDKAQNDLTIKKLTKDAPSVREKLEAARNQ